MNAAFAAAAAGLAFGRERRRTEQSTSCSRSRVGEAFLCFFRIRRLCRMCKGADCLVRTCLSMILIICDTSIDSVTPFCSLHKPPGMVCAFNALGNLAVPLRPIIALWECIATELIEKKLFAVQLALNSTKTGSLRVHGKRIAKKSNVVDDNVAAAAQEF